MASCRRNLPLLVAFIAAILTNQVLAENKQQEGQALLARAQQLQELRAPGNPGFRLTANFRLIDPTLGDAQGTYKEVWSSPDQWRRETIAGNYHQIEIANEKKHWAAQTLSFESSRFHQVWPLLSLSGTAPERPHVSRIHDEKISGVPARCVDLNAQENARETFCFDPQSGVLLYDLKRLIGSVWSAEYSDYASFGEHSYARTTRRFFNGKLSLELNITDLSAEQAPDKSLFAPFEGLQQLPTCSKTSRPESWLAPDPKYEPGPGSGRILVVLWVIIGPDGKPRDAKVLQQSQDSKFDASALEVVREWRFKPAKCDGQPIAVPLTIQVESPVR